jgi:hypothetical protein
VWYVVVWQKYAFLRGVVQKKYAILRHYVKFLGDVAEDIGRQVTVNNRKQEKTIK